MPGLALTPPLRSVVAPRALRRVGRAAGAAAALSLVAAWVHLAYTASHWQDWWAYGAFFLGMGLFQAACVPALVRWPRSAGVALAAIAGNLGVVGMYVLSRTAGVPMGPHEGVVEDAGAIDLAVTAAEVAIVACLLTVLRARPRALVVNLLLAGGGLLWFLRLTDQLP
jgi:hypothetical protein